jgi:hypothetical protein
MSFGHKEAKALLAQVDPSLTLAESQAVRAVASHETSYGEGWKAGTGEGSFNMGAIMTGEKEDSCTGFQHQDSNPEKTFTGCFKVYPNREAGLKDLVRVMLKSNVRGAAIKGDLLGVARAMFDNGYYTGTSHDPETNIERYHQKLRDNLDSIVAATGERDQFEKSPKRGNLTRVLAFSGIAVMIGYAAKTLFSSGSPRPSVRSATRNRGLRHG